MRPPALLLFALLLAAATVQAQPTEGGYAIRAEHLRGLGPRADLPFENAIVLAEGTNGLVWVGTALGVCFLDGASCRPVSLPEGTAAVGDLLPLPDGSVWAVTSGGAARVWPDGRVEAPEALRREKIRRAFRHPDGTVLFVASWGVLALAPDGTLTETPYRFPVVEPGEHLNRPDAGSGITDADIGPDGTLWVVDGLFGLARFGEDGRPAFVGMPKAPWYRYYHRVRTLGDEVLVVRHDRILRFRPAEQAVETVMEDRFPITLTRSGDEVFIGHEGKVWSWRAGAAAPRVVAGPAFGLDLPTVRAGLRTRSGALWLATERGLFHLPHPDVRHIERIDGAQLFYAAEPLVGVEGALWITSYRTGLFRLSPDPAWLTPRSDRLFGRLLRGADGHLDVQAESGWFRQRADGSWRFVGPLAGGIQGALAGNGYGYFWHDQGLYRHDPADPSRPVRLLGWRSADRHYYGFPWIGDDRLLIRARGVLLDGTLAADGSVRWDTLAHDLPGWEDASHGCSFPDTAGRIWTTIREHSLVRIDPRTGERLVVPLPGHRHVTYADDVILASSRSGLYVLDPETGRTLRHLTAADGLLTTHTTGATFHDGFLWVTHTGGVTRLPAENVLTPPDPPATILTEAGQEARAARFSFVAAEYAAPEHVRFEARVRSDAPWVPVEAGGVRYDALGPGAYRFEVRARVGDAAPGPAAAHAFAVAPFFYETAWFRLLVLAALGGLLAAAYRWRVAALRDRQRRLEATVAERTADLRAEKEKTEAQAHRLATLDEAKNRFFANVSHEFRTPLTLIAGPIEAGLEGDYGPLPTAVAARDHTVLRATRRLLRLVGKLLDLTRLDAGRFELRPQPGRVTAFAERVARGFAPLAEREGVGLEVCTRRGAPEPAVLFDADAVETVVSNLVSNAVKFTGRGGRVVVTVASEARGGRRWLEVAVADTGPGIAPDALGRLFDRFEQIHYENGRRGTGLGLALTKDLVDVMGGTLEVESELGAGSTFTARLPCVLAPDDAGVSGDGLATGDSLAAGGRLIEVHGDGLAAPEAASKPALDVAPAVSVPRVLVVDDNAELRALLRRTLGAAYRVAEAADGEAALGTLREATAAEDPFALVLADVMMPRLDGFGLCRAIREDGALAATPVVLVTARATAEDAIEGLLAGADDYVAKPFHAGELRARIARLLERTDGGSGEASGAGAVSVALPLQVAVPAAEEAFVREVLAVAEAHLGEPGFTADALAAEVGFSTRQLARRLKEAVGQTPGALVRELRLTQAALLLERDAGTVAEVGYRCGFRSASHFSQAFKARFGRSPSAYGDGAAD